MMILFVRHVFNDVKRAHTIGYKIVELDSRFE